MGYAYSSKNIVSADVWFAESTILLKTYFRNFFSQKQSFFILWSDPGICLP